tara:strand:- start:108 stop:296 length:189 start_codon:yes stop_codon:yes gene_type:complete
MSELITDIVNNLDTIIAVVTSIVAVASGVTALTPTPKDDKVVSKVYKVVEWLALNVGKAKDK